MKGYAGKILRVNLTRGEVSSIETKRYEKWGGGHGIGSALFFDLAKEKNISGFDPRNVVTIMTSPLTGTLVPGASARVEVQGIGVQSYPMEWFTRSNFGGRFGPMLKYAGWDGIAIEGKAASPVWLDIRNEKVKIRDARTLWGQDTWQTQQQIWQEAGARGDWLELPDRENGEKTTQRPAVLTIGPAGENLCRVACLVHDAGNAAGQGGFGAVLGSKNLKAISVLGAGSVEVADPKALMEARLWLKKHYTTDLNTLQEQELGGVGRLTSGIGSPPVPIVFWQNPQDARPQACTGCPAGCRSRYGSGVGNESACAESMWYVLADIEHHKGKQGGSVFNAADLSQRYGVNACELLRGLPYIRDLSKMGILGPGKSIDCDLPFDKYGTVEFAEKFLKMIISRKGIGDDMAEGFVRAAQRWGRLEEDLGTGLLAYPHWGLPVHYDPRAEFEWGYGSILGDRDINEHAFNLLFWLPSAAIAQGNEPLVSAEELTRIFSEKLMPFDGDPRLIDFSTDNMYSERAAKLVAWHRHYSRFWKQSALYCDLLFPNILNTATKDNRGLSGEGEPRFFNAVTGADYSFVDGMEVGRKIWNLDNAIWTLQGRHRDMVQFAEYMYKVPLTPKFPDPVHILPVFENGKWKYASVDGRSIDKKRFEEWKTIYYSLEGWDTATGWPQRKTLEQLGMANVADELEKKGKLGRARS
jgi:aldehyde:ferredoxin oxidoreductase